MFEYPEKGVSLIIVFFIMIIVLAIVLSISTLLYSEVKVVRNTGNSMASLYAADSGVEKVLYYDRQVVLNGAKRGLCSIFDSVNNPNYCSIDFDPNNPDHSIYCNTPVLTQFASGGCDINKCNNCEISFDATFDNRKYYITATVFPNGDFEVESKGVFGSTGRQVKILITAQ